MVAVPIEVDYDELAANTSFTTQLELLRVTVPSLPDPVYLTATGAVSLVSGTASAAALFLMPPGAVGFGTEVLDIINELAVDTLVNAPNGRKFHLFYRLPPDSPGDYVLYAQRASGTGTLQAMGQHDPLTGRNFTSLRAERR